MSATFTAACVQLNAKREIEANLPDISELVAGAVDQGADFITLPECTGMIEPDRERMIANTPLEGDHAALFNRWLLACAFRILR